MDDSRYPGRHPAMAATLLLVCGLALGAGRAAAQDAGGIPVGAAAPVIHATELNGRSVPLAAIGHRPVLIEFWATWCPYCERLEPRMKALYTRYGARVQFYAIAVNVNESPERVRRHVAERGLRYPVLYDASGEATRAYDVPATSFVVVADAAGRVTYTGLGSDQDLDAALRRVLQPQRGVSP
jgi:thiol-disulfide isomerase/thioredoxin